MQKLLLISLIAANSMMPIQTVARATGEVPIIIDTDFVMPPADDSMAVMLALQSPELDVLGITTVAGNDSVERATSDVLRMLEIARRTEIPVFQGANLPTVRVKSDFAIRNYGNWYSDEPPPAPPGGFARKRAETKSAVAFIVETVLSRPGQVTLVALGPLTNIARAIRDEPTFAENVKRIVVMGGAIALLPDGAGNMTPNAEFNFWVDPEAAYVTLRSGIDVELSPLNVSRKSALTKQWYKQLIAKDTPLTALLKDALDPHFDAESAPALTMFDQIAMASVIDPSLVTKERLFVDVNIDHGISYGESVGGREMWPGAEGAQQVEVQYDLEWERFIQLFIERIQRPLDPKGRRG